MFIPDEAEGQFVELLAHIYRAIPWAKIATSRNAWDVWNHRVRASSTRGTMGEFVSHLCNRFGIQNLEPDAIRIIEQLRPIEGELLDLVYREHIPIAMRAVMRAKEMKGARLHGRTPAREDHSTEPDLPLRGREDGVDADPAESDALGLGA